MESAAPRSAPPVELPWWAAFDPRRSLAARAVIVAGGGAVGFVLVLAWIGGASLHRQLERPLGASLEAMAFQLCDTLDRAAYERSRELQFAASLPALRLAATPPSERRRLLESLLDASPDYAWLGFADADGKIVSATQGLLEKTDAAMSPWFRGAHEQLYTGEVREVPELALGVRRPSAGPPRFIALATPVVSPDNLFLGVLVAQLNWSWARDVQAAQLPEAARRARVSVTVYSAKGEALLDSGTSGWTEPPGAPELADRRQVRGFFRETVSGDAEYLTGFARSRGFRSFRGLGTVVVARQPAADLDASVAALRRMIVTWGMALAVGLATACGVIAHRVTRRLRAVGVAAERIRAGDILSLMPRARGEQEVDRMCGALDAMVDDFRQKQEKLDPEKSRPEVLPGPVAKDRDISKYV